MAAVEWIIHVAGYQIWLLKQRTAQNILKLAVNKHSGWQLNRWVCLELKHKSFHAGQTEIANFIYQQLELSMKAKEEDIKVKWSFIHTSETNTEVKPINAQQVCLAVVAFI